MIGRNSMPAWPALVVATVMLVGCAGAMREESRAGMAPLLGVACESPPPLHCAAGGCAELMAERGNAMDRTTGRAFFLDYPCDLRPDEKVLFILNIHGAGSIANWQRHYFPAMDYKEKYRLVVATPTAEGSGSMGGSTSRPGTRMWMSDLDDAHLKSITNLVFDALGERVGSFWLAGHSQGGGTSHRLVCTEFFRDKVDGLLSLSGGRIGGAPMVAAFGPPAPDGSPPAPRERRFGDRSMPDCDFSHIYTTGEHEIVSLPETSPWAEKYGCDARVQEDDVVDTGAGWVYDSNRAGYPVWGMAARPGEAEVFTYPNCRDGRVVADVVRIDKGHTEGLEPRVTERIIQLMSAAAGGKARGDR